MHPLYIPAPYQDSAESGRVILRDGSTATIRIATERDINALTDFFRSLSPESHRQRFLSFAQPSAEFLEFLCDSSHPEKQLTLVISRLISERHVIVAAGSYVGGPDKSAEVSFAVADHFQGKGIGSHLLERLALLAARAGFTRFWALTRLENKAMMEVFRHSGFQTRERIESGNIEVDFSVLPTEASVGLSEMRDRVVTVASLRPFFNPNGVAVIGASRDVSSIGYRILQALISNRFEGPVYPVNPNATVVGSTRAYSSVSELPEVVDLAVIAVPSAAVLGVVDECAAAGVKAVVVITAGFSEAGEEGRLLQAQLLERVRGHGMRMVGPNCMGLMNTDPSMRLNASFSPVFPPTGRIAMSSQSGALGIAILALAKERSLGISTFVSVGNKADVSGNDLLQYWEVDDNTRVILLYLESFGNPRRFARIARRVGRVKPIIAVKAGRTLAGRRAAGSHTAALAASDVAVDALFRQTGVIRAETLDEMFDVAAMLDNQPLIGGRRIAIITNAGGPGILCTDACEAGGLTVPELSEVTKSKLRSLLPPAAGITNPVDMIASAKADSYRKTIETILPSEEIDALIVIYIPIDRNDSDEIADAIRDGVQRGRTSGGEHKPVVACLMSNSGSSVLISGKETIPSYRYPESAAKVLSKTAAYSESRSKPPGMVPWFEDIRVDDAKRIVAHALQSRGEGWLSAVEVRDILQAFGIRQVPAGLALTADDASRISRAIGFPVALKLASPRVLHKTEVGAVRLNLQDDGEVRRVFDEIKQEGMEGIIVQKMIQNGVELMMGVAPDPLFGPLIAFGLGGIHVEILADVRFRITPLTDQDAKEMVQEIRGHRLLEGYRGHAAADVEAIEEILLRVSRMVEEVHEISELDLNPIFGLSPGSGCIVADARFRISNGLRR